MEIPSFLPEDGGDVFEAVWIMQTEIMYVNCAIKIEGVDIVGAMQQDSSCSEGLLC